MTNPELLEQIADQARIVRRLQRQFYRNRDTGMRGPLLRDAMAAEVTLDRLLARRDGVEDQLALFGEGE
jgi:hypothetical protein